MIRTRRAAAAKDRGNRDVGGDSGCYNKDMSTAAVLHYQENVREIKICCDDSSMTIIRMLIHRFSQNNRDSRAVAELGDQIMGAWAGGWKRKPTHHFIAAAATVRLVFPLPTVSASSGD